MNKQELAAMVAELLGEMGPVVGVGGRGVAVCMQECASACAPSLRLTLSPPAPCAIFTF